MSHGSESDNKGSAETEINQLKKEISELRKTVQSLSQTVTYLTEKLACAGRVSVQPAQMGYSLAPTLQDCIECDESWKRLMGIVREAGPGLTARELAIKWGKSRSRTSEVLNTLVEQGYLTKYRDGREIKFRFSRE